MNIYLNQWEMEVTEYRQGTKYYYTCINGSEKRFRVGEIVNDFLSLGRYDEHHQAVALEDRLKIWLKKYKSPPLTYTEKENRTSESGYTIVKNEYHPVASTFSKDHPVSIWPLPHTIENYKKVVSTQWDRLNLIALGYLEFQCNQNATYTYEFGTVKTLQIFYNDFFPVILKDVARCLERYGTARICRCGAKYFPVNGLTHCPACKPLSRSVKSNASQKERDRLRKRYERAGLSKEQVNAELAKRGFNPLRGYKVSENASK